MKKKDFTLIELQRRQFDHTAVSMIRLISGALP